MGKRQQAREQVERRIIELGRAHLATEGAAGLSLRAIARDLGMVSSAVYRYVASRDELLTLLLVDAYTELATTVDRARADAVDRARADAVDRARTDAVDRAKTDAVDRAHRTTVSGVRDQLTAMALSAREWALGQPACWALLYGSPVPGYRAPAERTVGPGTRVIAALFETVSAIPAGTVPITDVPQRLSEDFERLRAEFGVTVDDAVMQRCLVLWAGLIGAISLEVFGQYGADTFTDRSAVFAAQVRLLVDLAAPN